MAIVNPDSSKTGEDLTGDTHFKVDLGPGSVKLTGDTLDNAVDDSHFKINVSQGTEKANLEDVHGSKLDKVKSVPSGLSILGVPTYGDGASVITTTWPDDHEISENGEFTYFRPFEIQKKDYDELAT